MKTLSWFTFLLAATGLTLAALDSVLPSLGIDQKTIRRMAQDQLRSTGSFYPGAYLPRPVVERLKSLTGPQRAAAVTEALSVAKAIIGEAEFAQAHEAYLTSNLRAANHGIDIEADARKTQRQMETDPEKAIRDTMTVAGAQMAQGLRKLDRNGLKMMIDMDLEGGDAKLKKIATLLDSNFEECRREYSLWKSASMGGPSTESAYQAALSQGSTQKDRQKLLDEQRAWNQYNLKSMLRQKLDAFIATASSVDFAAQTAAVNGKQRFVNPKYEAKPGDWKMLYRAGKEPVGAALAFARQWRQEL